MLNNLFSFRIHMIHFVETKYVQTNLKHPQNIRLHHFLPICDDIMKHVIKYFIEGRNFNIDGSMIKYTGMGIRFVHLIPKKPINYGIKLFSLVSSHTG